MGGDVLSDILYGLGHAARRATTIGGDPEAVATVRSGERLMADEDAGRAMGLNPARRGVFDPVIDEISAGYRGTEAPPSGDIALPAPPQMMPPRRPPPPLPPPSSQTEPPKNSRKEPPPPTPGTSTSTQGETATGRLNPSVAGQPPRIPAWMAAGSQPRFGGPTPAQDAAAERLAANLGPGETLSRNLPGSMANVLSDIGFDETMNARDQATLGRTKTAIDQEQAAQVLDDLTGGTQRRIRGLALDNVLTDMLPAGSKSRIAGTYGPNGIGGNMDLAGVTGEKELGGMSLGEEKAMDRIIAGQQGKMASAQNEHTARQGQLQVISDLRKKKGMIQAKLAAGAIDPKGAQAEWEYEKQLADRTLQALGGGKNFLPQGDQVEASVFSTDQKGG